MSGVAPPLRSRIDSRQARVAVVGLGYVGLPLEKTFALAGFPVLGFDVDPDKVACLRRGDSYIGHLPRPVIQAMQQAGFVATDRFDRLQEAEAIVICVP